MECIRQALTKEHNVIIGVLFLMLCFPLQAFSGSIIYEPEVRNGFYIGGAYRSSFPNFSDLEVREEESFSLGLGSTFRRMSMRGDVAIDIGNTAAFMDYRPSFYDKDYLGFSGSMGYNLGSFRFEIEGFRNSFRLKRHAKSAHEDDASYIALVRGNNINAYNYVVVKNKGIGITSAVFNACYDLKSKTASLIYYMCLGVSGSIVDIVETQKFAHGYYGKMGVGFSVTPNVSLFVGGYYHMVHRKHFDALKLIIPQNFNSFPRASFAEAHMDVSSLGGEMGIRYFF